MAVHASHAAIPYPIKGARYSIAVPFIDADGDPTAQTTPDTEISEDNAAATDAAEEVSATSGMDGVGLITFTGAETDCSVLAVNFKAASGPKATLATLYPRVLAEVGTGTLSAGSAGGGTLGTLLAYDVTGCFIKTTGGTGGGGTGGANNQARKIVTYVTSTGAFTVTPNWETTPSTDTTYAVLLPEGVTLGMLRTLNPATAGRTLVVESDGMAYADAREWLGGTIATPTVAGVPEVDVTHWIGTAAATPTVAGVPEVDVTHYAGSTTDVGTIPASVAAILVDTAEIGAAGAGLTNINLPNQTMDIVGNITGSLSGSVGSVTGAVGSVTGAVGSVTGAVGSVTGNVGGNVVGSVGSVTGAVTLPTIPTAWITADGIAANAVTEIAGGVWDLATAGHTTSGTFGAAMVAAGSAGDPWSTSLPGAYGAGTAGFIVGTNIDALITSRMATYTQPAGFLAATFPTTVASTTNITAATGIAVSSIGANVITAASLAADTGTEIGAAVWASAARTLTSLSGLSVDANVTLWRGVQPVALDIDGTVYVNVYKWADEMASTVTVGADQIPYVAAQVVGMNANTLTALALATDAVAEIQSGLSTAVAVDALPTNAELATALGTADDAILAAIAALNNLSAAQVNAELVDALNVDTYVQPTGVPAATATLAAKINRIYQALTSELTVTATAKTFFSHGGASLWKKVLSDDGTTYTEADASAP